MRLRKATLLALCVLLLGSAATGAALAQTNSDWGKAVDLKPLLPPIVPPLLPPNSVLTPGTVGDGSQSTYSSAPRFDSGATPAPGLKLTIPTR